MQDSILIVDDEPLVCKSLSELVTREGYKAQVAYDAYEALQTIQQDRFPVVVADINMPKMNGLELMQRTKESFPDTAVILITGYATVESAIEAMKSGAHDYICKPFTQSEIKAAIENAFADVSDSSRTTDSYTFHQDNTIVTADPQMLDILDKVGLIARTDSTVLIQGESGTGKELIARAIHRNSRRANGPYVAFNCAALPESLIESELFGHEKGSFTGAIARRIGKFEMAHRGTILLDEVSEMAMPLQAKLLRALQQREIVRVGGTESIKLDVRIIATTNTDLSGEVDAGKFREDLFYRLCVVPLFLPPLRERKGDVPLLAQHFIQQFCRQMGMEAKALSQEAMKILEEYNWPGNVRELENTIERAVALSQNSTLSPDDLFFTTRKKLSRCMSFEIGTSLRDIEKEIIIRTLEDVGGNKQRTAEVLGITSKTIRSKLRQYGYDSPSQSPDISDIESDL
jgi:two-component system response regulator AtoC